MGMVVGLRAILPEPARAVEGISDRAHAESAARTVGQPSKTERSTPLRPAVPAGAAPDREVA
jgi:hypothetical protein